MLSSLRYPAINKPAGVVHWLKHSKDAENVDWVVILDADMIVRGPIIPWEIGAEKGKPVAAYYGYECSVVLNLSAICFKPCKWKKSAILEYITDVQIT